MNVLAYKYSILAYLCVYVSAWIYVNYVSVYKNQSFNPTEIGKECRNKMYLES